MAVSAAVNRTAWSEFEGAARAQGRPRVLHVAEAFGGGLLEMVRLLAERGAAGGAPQAIAFGRRPETPADVRAAIDPRVELFEIEGWGRRRPGSERHAARELRRIAADWDAEVVHLHSSFAGLTGVHALRGQLPLIYTPHAFASELPDRGGTSRAVFRAMERRIVRCVDVVGAVSESEGAVADALGAQRVAVIPNGIAELDGVRPRLASPRAPRAIASGRLVGQRRPEACARILAAVADVADVAWVGGGGAERAVTDRARAALDAAGVPVTGWVPRERMLDELRASTAYLHWTCWDGLPLSVLEAMACDTVVVASDTPPNRELLDPRQLCASEEQAVALLRRVVTDPALADELRAAQADRRWMFSSARMASAWQALHRTVAEGAGRAPTRAHPAPSRVEVAA